MTCDVCHKYQPVLSHVGSLEFRAKGGLLKIHGICEECQGKIEDFLKALGWSLSGAPRRRSNHEDGEGVGTFQ